ncbi:MAG TPA: hypothetical protein VK111_14530 [Virgibacillus sp.]|nr:hypothetical protein [Virgibacillus sp.]
MSVTRYYVSGNTAEGYINKLTSNVDTMTQIIYLNHPSKLLKTWIIKQIIESYGKSPDLEILCSSLSKEYIEGMIMRKKSMAIVDGCLDTGEFTWATRIDLTELKDANEQGMKALFSTASHINELLKKAYTQFEIGLRVHDDLEAIYIQEMDFDVADQMIAHFISQHVNTIPDKKSASHIYHRMFGTNTAEGAVNVASEIMYTIPERFILKGRAGTGKSVFMKRVTRACEQKGLDIELYHCSFDPSSIDMVVVRDHFCMIDGTDPHEMNPERPTDIIIDLYEKTVTPGTDEKYAEQIHSVTKEYKSYMKEGMAFMKQAGRICSKQENLYMQMVPETTRQGMLTKVFEFLD